MSADREGDWLGWNEVMRVDLSFSVALGGRVTQSLAQESLVPFRKHFSGQREPVI